MRIVETTTLSFDCIIGHQTESQQHGMGTQSSFSTQRDDSVLYSTDPPVNDTTTETSEKNRYPRDCEDLGKVSSGVYRIHPLNDSDLKFDVYCEMETAGGGWTVFQRRLDGTVEVFRNWTDYENGFGDISREFWLGNSKIHILTSEGKYELYILLEDFKGTQRYARYGTFNVGDSASGYLLTVGQYTGNAGDSFSYQNNQKFSTKDRGVSKQCANTYKGAWWYTVRGCHKSNLNGRYLNGHHTSHADGINWGLWRGYSYSHKQSVMMVRRLR